MPIDLGSNTALGPGDSTKPTSGPLSWSIAASRYLKLVANASHSPPFLCPGFPFCNVQVPSAVSNLTYYTAKANKGRKSCRLTSASYPLISCMRRLPRYLYCGRLHRRYQCLPCMVCLVTLLILAMLQRTGVGVNRLDVRVTGLVGSGLGRSRDHCLRLLVCPIAPAQEWFSAKISLAWLFAGDQDTCWEE